MAKLFFRFGSMNSGKTTMLLQTAFNYEEQGMATLILKPVVDTRETIEAFVSSRVGLKLPTVLFSPDDNLEDVVMKHFRHVNRINAVLVDEAQFLTEQQVSQLCNLVDFIAKIPVLCFGLRTDFQGRLFPGSAALLAQAEEITEVRGICSCGRRSTHVLRRDVKGNVVRTGNQIEIGGNDRYDAVCRKCHSKALKES